MLMTADAIVTEQLELLLRMTRTWARRAMAGKSDDVTLFLQLQGHVEHWMQYLPSASTMESVEPGTIPPPLEAARPAPPLMPEPFPYTDVFDGPDETRVSFPPDPIWMERGGDDEELP